MSSNHTALRNAAVILLLLLAIAPRIHAAAGDLDPLDLNIPGSLLQDSVQAIAMQPDGKIIIGGRFTSVLGVRRNNIARLNANGTLDTGFDPAANDLIECVAVQSDGKVLLGGSFTTLQPNGALTPTERFCIARVHADGTLDVDFNPKAGGILAVDCMAVQPDGKVLLGGQFNTLQPNGALTPISRKLIARVNADGTLDMAFDPKVDGIAVFCMALQADGKVLIGGAFNSLQPNGAPAPTTRDHIARVNADGTLDTGFNLQANGWIYNLTIQADGKLLIGGAFSVLLDNGGFFLRRGLARVNADGTPDAGFFPNPGALQIYSVAVQADGKILLSGSFYSIDPNGSGAEIERYNIARVNPNGTLDYGFDPKVNAGVVGMAVQADGKVLLGGFFSTLQPNGAASPTTRTRFARVVNDPATQTLSTPVVPQVFWQRSDASPEVSRVTFELSTNGGASWTPLGAGSRVGSSAHWQCTGLSLPASGSLRARGVTAGGIYNSSSGLIEQCASFGIGNPFPAWKLALLGDVGAPDDGDTDFDGLRTILEYATGGDPRVHGALPAGRSVANTLAITFTRNAAATDVTLTVQGSDELHVWSDLARSTGGAAMVALIDGVTVNEFSAGALRTVDVRDLYLTTDPAHAHRFLRLHAVP